MTPIPTKHKIVLALSFALLIAVLFITTPLGKVFKPRIEVVEVSNDTEQIKKLKTTIKTNEALLLLNDSMINILEYKIDSLQTLLTINNNTLQLIKKRRTNVQKFDYSALTDSTINDFFAKRYQ